MKFELTSDQLKKYNTWIKKQKIVYTGAIDVGPKFSFTGTSIGCIVEVEYGGNKLNLSEDW